MEQLREAGPSGLQNPAEQNIPPQMYHRGSHDCEGPSCLCQRYENGELAVVVMNQNRNAANSDREDNYQNACRGHRNHPHRSAAGQLHPSLNPNYQNPVDLIRNYDREQRRLQEPEENIYERLDEDLDSEYNFPRNGRNSPDPHAYERIDNRPWHRGNAGCRGAVPHGQNVPGPSGSNDCEPNRNPTQHDRSRNFYLDSRGLSNQSSCLSRLGRLGRLGRNCFSTENIAYASNRRYVYQLGHSCSCPYCRHLDARYICHYCHNFHDRLRHHDSGGQMNNFGNSRHYIYQLSRSCRCAFCRGESLYARFPVNARLSDSFRRDCNCRSPGNCTCRSRFLSYSNPAIYVGRIDRSAFQQSVNNPLYASPTIYIGRPDRSCGSGLNNIAYGLNSSNPGESNASISNASTSNASAGPSEAASCSNRTNPNPSTSNNSDCSVVHATERHHICDDSCARNQNGNVGSVYQFLGRCEKNDCQHGRVSFHWIFVNKWLPSWGSQNVQAERNPEQAAREEEPREQPESDSDES